ncbi:MAG: hypothetical protein EXX96DRAFT_581139 [Benjaminiella poitrasii]|nr:MAG: hypothetical protein EXX96DRAFT_581139 [Benjaminiella poitrasii]
MPNTTTKKMLLSLDNMAPEVIYNMMSFMSYPEVYRLRSVCRKLKAMGEYHIYQQIKSSGQRILIKLDGGGKGTKTSLELYPTQYDAKNGVIEFRPLGNHTTALSLANTSSHQWSAYHRLLKIHFSGWFDQEQKTSTTQVMNQLSPQEQALLLYHSQYNSSIERTYELPSWNSSSSTNTSISLTAEDNNNIRYLGDKNLILSLSYQKPSLVMLSPQYHHNYSNTVTGNTLPTSFYSYRSAASTTPIPSAPKMEVQWVRVTMDWVLTGLEPNIKANQIYKDSFDRLDQLLAKEGCYKYDPLSEPILNYIVKQQEYKWMIDLPESLLNYVQAHTHECHTRLSRLQHMLEGAGVDARVLWKYTFAKSFVVGNGSLLVEEDVVRRIQDSEEEWRQKKVSLSRKFQTILI